MRGFRSLVRRVAAQVRDINARRLDNFAILESTEPFTESILAGPKSDLGGITSAITGEVAVRNGKDPGTGEWSPRGHQRVRFRFFPRARRFVLAWSLTSAFFG